MWDTIGIYAAIGLVLLITLIASRVRMPDDKGGKKPIKPTYTRLK
jgi:hypothetical protein